MKFLLALKQDMLQVFDDRGAVSPVTSVLAGPVVVTQIKTKSKDGYDAIQVAFGETKQARVSKSVQGHAKNLGNFRFFREIPATSELVATVKVGDKLDAGVFAKGDKVTVSGTSRGKGFQGAVKRHGFAGGSRTHGQKHSEREVGSIGGGLRTRVPKGMRMAGRMGGDRVTVKNLTIIDVNPATNTLLIKGALPGVKGSLLEVIA
jgi:large subunit ribosomal protein L3